MKTPTKNAREVEVDAGRIGRGFWADFGLSWLVADLLSDLLELLIGILL